MHDTRGTRHHPLLALDAPSDFRLIDRNGDPARANCDVRPLAAAPGSIGKPEAAPG